MTNQEKLNFIIAALGELDIQSKSIDISPDLVLADAGIDSLDAVELQMYYEEKTGVETADPKGPVITVQDLMDLMP